MGSEKLRRRYTSKGKHMNRAQIIRMTRAACDTDKVDAWHNGFWTLTQEELERFAALVAAHEREACAKVVENYCGAWDDGGYALAAAIRARGNEKRERDHRE